MDQGNLRAQSGDSHDPEGFSDDSTESSRSEHLPESAPQNLTKASKSHESYWNSRELN
jgi:hypothetical protein